MFFLKLLIFFTFFSFAFHLWIILIPLSFVLTYCCYSSFLQSVNVVFRGFDVEQNFVTSQSSLTTSTSVSGLLPSTVYMVTVTGIYNGPGCPSVYKNNGIKTDIEKGTGPGKLVQCLQMQVHAYVGVGV